MPALSSNLRIWNGTAVSGAADFVSLPVAIEGVIVAVEIQMTGTPTGSFSWELSDQYDPVTNPGATFVSGGSPAPALPAPAGAPISYAGSLHQVVSANRARYARLRYTNTAGDGVIDAWVHYRRVMPL